MIGPVARPPIQRCDPSTAHRSTRVDVRFHRLYNGIERHGQTIGAWCTFCNSTIGESNASHGEFDAVECARAAVQTSRSEFQLLQTTGLAMTCPEFISSSFLG